jgi:hypothetical protein
MGAGAAPDVPSIGPTGRYFFAVRREIAIPTSRNRSAILRGSSRGCSRQVARTSSTSAGTRGWNDRPSEDGRGGAEASAGRYLIAVGAETETPCPRSRATTAPAVARGSARQASSIFKITSSGVLARPVPAQCE